MWKYSIFFINFLIGNSWAIITDEEVKIAFTKQVMKCTKTHPVDMAELTLLQNLKTPTKRETKCLLACAYKNDKTMNDKGLYDLEYNYGAAQRTSGNNEKRLANARKLVETCAKVNDVKVSDGDKGCDRAALIFTCIVKTAPKLGFRV